MEGIALFASFFLVCLFAGYYVWYMFFSAPYVPSFGKDRRVILDEAKKILPLLKLKSAIEPGAGDANISFALARMGYQNVAAVELVPFLTVFARLRKLLGRYKQVAIYNENIYNIDYSKYDLAVIYLYPSLMAKLEPILYSQMPKGSYIISNTFQFKQHQPIRNIGKILVYEVK